MADILIRGMEMPKSCDVCPFVGTNDDLMSDDYRYLYCGFPYMGQYVSDYEASRHHDCPLVPLPEGPGDLVERKALNLFPDYKEVRNRIKKTIEATERDGRNITGVTIDLLKQTLVALDSLCSVRRYFLNAKTIVPAEGGAYNAQKAD